MPDFGIFFPSNFESDDSVKIAELINERNSLQILNNSCVKSNANLEFELKTKSAAGGSKSVKTRVTGIHSESENESNDPNAKHK